MKCPNCGKSIGIEVLECPACGYTNPLAKKHNENIRKYDKRFKKTQDSVLSSAQKTTGVGIRGGIFAILVAVIIILVFVWASVSADKGITDEDRKKDALQNKAEYSAQMREYLDEGDYITFTAFVRNHNIPFNTEPYNEYSRLKYVAEEYYNCVHAWEEVIFRSDDPDFWDSSELNISHLCMYIEAFTEAYEYNAETDKNTDLKPYYNDMNSDFRAMLRRYLKMTDTEVDEFLGYSRAQKAVIMEDILLGEESEDE